MKKIVFTKTLDCLNKLKSEKKKVGDKIVEYRLQLHAHNGSWFDTWMFLNNLPCDRRIVDLIENGKGIFSLKVLNGYIQSNKKQIPRNIFFSCGMTHLIYSLKKLCKTYKKQEDLLRT